MIFKDSSQKKAGNAGDYSHQRVRVKRVYGIWAVLALSGFVYGSGSNSTHAQRSKEVRITPLLSQELALSSVIKKLRAIIEDYEEFIQAFPQELLPKERDSFEQNALMMAVPKALKNKPQEFKDGVLRSVLIQYLSNAGHYNALHWVVALIKAGANAATECRYVAPVRLVSEKGHFLGQGFDEQGSISPLALVDRMQNAAYANALLSHKVMHRIPGSYYPTVAWQARTLPVAKTLYNKGVSIKGLTPNNENILHRAVDSDIEPAVLEFYLTLGMKKDINRQTDMGGETPLHRLARKSPHYNNSSDLLAKAKLLVRYGADKAMVSKDCKTPCEFVRMWLMWHDGPAREKMQALCDYLYSLDK